MVWATAQYLDFAKVGETMDLDVHVSASGRYTTQARVIGRVGDREIITVNAALGQRELDLHETWPVAPDVQSPDECRPREYDYDQDSLGKHLDQRFAPTTTEKLGGPTGHGPGRLCVWTKPPDGVQNSAATLAVLGDFVPMGISNVASQPVGSNSLDNTLRIIDVRAGQMEGRSRYGAPLSCTGRLVPRGAGTQSAATFTEVITRSASSRCVGIGTMRLRLRSDGRLAYRWTGGGVTSTALLTRAR